MRHITDGTRTLRTLGVTEYMTTARGRTVIGSEQTLPALKQRQM